MPAPPEICDRAGNIRIVEVFREGEAEHPAKTNRHVRIAGKIKVDLEGIGKSAQPCRQRGQRSWRNRRRLLPQLSDAVGQQHFFDNAAQEAPRSRVKALPGFTAVLQCIAYIDVPHDRPRDELREHCHITAEGDDVPLRGAVAAVNIDGIGKGLKGVKRDADGQCDPWHGQGEREQSVDRFHQQSGILEKAEQPKVDGQRGDQSGAPQSGPRVPALHQAADGIIRQRRKQHQHHIDWFTPGVKHQADDKQNGVARPARREKIDQQRGGQKEQQKTQAGKHHARKTPPWLDFHLHSSYEKRKKGTSPSSLQRGFFTRPSVR